MITKITGGLHIILIFITGLLSGVFIYAGIVEFSQREGWHVGGETLILPLMILLIYFGWSIGTETNKRQNYLTGYRDGYKLGKAKGIEALNRYVADEMKSQECEDNLKRHDISY